MFKLLQFTVPDIGTLRRCIFLQESTSIKIAIQQNIVNSFNYLESF